MKKPKFFTVHPILAAFVLPALALLWVSLGDLLSGILPEKFNPIFVGLFSLLLLPVHKWLYRPEYRGSFSKDGLKNKTAFIGAEIILLLSIADLSIGFVKDGYNPFEFSYILNGFQAGCSEEVMFRAIPVSVMMAFYKDKKSLVPLFILNCLPFGLLHLTNLSGGAAVAITLLQVVTSSAAGLLYCTLYLSTGNIIIPLILHSVKDVLAFWGIGSDAALTLSVTPELIIEETIIILIEVLVSILILKNQKDSIPKVWDERWSHST